ncbi:SIMPL domain-containing protein [Lutibaculum baratangense]|uniref:Outer membrane protein n=1 Tax=Lutibaculum baratangense AMV1 TaxID=631454 RepID=V4RNV7_9HYPH|nr:SIMPL domain-containing protein [Lutibaculum baratangense]ESR26929.1 Protein of unknown function DUF541 [Lutibaculum baratangense AMV1]
MLRSIPLTAAVLAASLAAAPAWAQGDSARDRTIAVTGSAETGAAPDRATVTVGVVTEAATAESALERNNEAVRALIDTLKAQGVEARDLQTSGFSVSPQYVYPPRQNDGSQEAPRIVGYTVSNNVSARLRQLDGIGAVLDASVKAGANQIHGISFDVSDADTLVDEARKQAFANARRKAELYAEAAGATLGAVVSISESTRRDQPPIPMMRMEAAKDSAVPVETGEQTLGVQVEVTWTLED